jgi:hypothetical protein
MSLLQFVLVYILLQPFGFSIISSEELLLSNELGHITQHAWVFVVITQQLMLACRVTASKCFGVYIGPFNLFPSSRSHLLVLFSFLSLAFVVIIDYHHVQLYMLKLKQQQSM